MTGAMFENNVKIWRKSRFQNSTPNFAPVWPVALKLGRVASFDALFVVVGSIRLIYVLYEFLRATILMNEVYNHSHGMPHECHCTLLTHSFIYFSW